MPSLSPTRRSTIRRAATITTATAAACALALVPLTAASAAVVPDPITYSADDAALTLSPLGSFETGVFDESAAEIVAAYQDRLFVVNALAGSVSVLDYADPTAIAQEFSLSSDGVANSVAVRADGLGIIAFEAPVKTDPGHLVFFDANATDAASAVLGAGHGRRAARHGVDLGRRRIRGRRERGRAGRRLLGRPRGVGLDREPAEEGEARQEAQDPHAEGRPHGRLPRVRGERQQDPGRGRARLRPGTARRGPAGQPQPGARVHRDRRRHRVRGAAGGERDRRRRPEEGAPSPRSTRSASRTSASPATGSTRATATPTARRRSRSAPTRVCTASTCPTASTPTPPAARPTSSRRTRAMPASGATTSSPCA